MLLAGQRLRGQARSVVERHLQECEPCRERHGRLTTAHQVFERLSEVGLNEVITRSPDRSRSRGTPVLFPWKPVAGILAASFCVVAFLFFPKTVPQASASELLANAVRGENQSAPLSFYRLEVGGTDCAAGQGEELVFYGSTSSCDRALARVKSTGWGRGNPLSPQTFRAWHDGLHRFTDSVSRRNASWQIQTSTEDGPIQTASLELRTSDYHPTALTLRFDDEEEVTISEETVPSPVVEVAQAVQAMVNSAGRNETLDGPGSPADLLEVKAWQALHRVGADSGWEALVLRDGDQVVVAGLVPDTATKETLEAAVKDSDPRIQAELRTYDTALPSDRELIPERDLKGSPGGSEVPPDKDWLAQQFPNEEDRSAYRTRVSELSRLLLGEAFLYDKLDDRYRGLGDCSCKKLLIPILQAHRDRIVTLQRDLAGALEPLWGTAPAPISRPITYAQAEALDAALHNTVVSRIEDSPGLKQQLREA